MLKWERNITETARESLHQIEDNLNITHNRTCVNHIMEAVQNRSMKELKKVLPGNTPPYSIFMKYQKFIDVLNNSGKKRSRDKSDE